MAKGKKGKTMRAEKTGAARRFNSIGATDIRHERGDVAAEDHEVMNGDGTRTTLYNIDKVQSQLKRMFNRQRQICLHQYMAGERFAHDYEMSQVSMKSCLNTGAGGGGTDLMMPSTVGGSFASSKAMAVLGPLKGVVIDVAVEGHPASEWAERNKISARSGIDFLRMGLSALVRHYGLDCDCQSAVSAQQG